MNNPLSGTHKTNITLAETALATVINQMNPNDTSQAAALQTFRQMRKLLGQIKTERAN